MSSQVAAGWGRLVAQGVATVFATGAVMGRVKARGADEVRAAGVRARRAQQAGGALHDRPDEGDRRILREPAMSPRGRSRAHSSRLLDIWSRSVAIHDLLE